jgi:WD40 repeat protein
MTTPINPNESRTLVGYKYYAFISYNREDEEWAKWLQYKLEHYKLPSNLNGRTDLPKEIRPVFKDTSELNPGNLPQQIQDALEQSKYLIVICSPRAAKSEWVNKEVESFMKMGRTDRVIPFIIDGKAFAKNPSEECFPKAIRHLPSEQEILGANIGEMGREAAVVKVIAQMFELKFDELWQRHEREHRKRRNWIIAISTFGFFIMAGIAFWMYAQRQQTMKANWKMMENQARFVSEKACSLMDEGDSYTAQRILLEVLPNDLENMDRPYTIEAESALRYAYNPIASVIKGHESALNSVCYSPDGKNLMTASNDGVISIWDIATTKEIKRLETHNHAVNSANYSPDGKYIVSTSADYIVRVWDIETAQAIKQWDHIGLLYNASFSPDGKKIVAATYYGTKVWSFETGELIKELEGYSLFSCFSPNGKHIVSALADSTIRIWDAETGQEIRKLEGHTSAVMSANYSPDSKRIASTSWDHTTIIWDVETGLEIRRLHEQDNYYPVCFSPDGKYILAVSNAKTAGLWDTETGLKLQDLKGSGSYLRAVCFSPDSRHAAAAFEDGNTCIWDIETELEYWRLEGHSNKRNNTNSRSRNKAKTKVKASFSSDGELIVAALDDHSVRLLNYSSRKEILRFEGHTGAVSSASFSPDDSRIVSASSDSTIRLWDVKTGKELKELKGHTASVTQACFNPDGNLIVSVSDDKTIRIWDVETGKELSKMEGLPDDVNSVSFSPDGIRIVSASSDSTIRVWDVNTGQVIMMLRGHDDAINQAVYSPDGKHIASASSDHTIRIWDSNTGKEIRNIDGGFFEVMSVTYSPDNKYIVSVSFGDGIIISAFDAETGKEVRKLETHLFPYYACFNPNGKQVLVSASSYTLIFWEFPSLQELINQTHDRFKNYPLTPDERRLYYLE